MGANCRLIDGEINIIEKLYCGKIGGGTGGF